MIGNYRTAEGETLDITNNEVRSWMASNFPAVMANRPVGMSSGYQFMPTWKLAQTLQEDFGMGIVAIGQQTSRKRDPAGQEHFLRFRMPGSKPIGTGDSFPELVLFNSHNGRSTIRAYAGIFRLVCANGMVVSEASFGKIDVRHFGEGNRYDIFAGMLQDMGGRFKTLDSRISMMKDTILTVGQQHQLARLLTSYRKAPNWVSPEMVIAHHRDADAPLEDGRRDLWLTFNVIQENLTSRDDIALEMEGYRRRAIRSLTGARAEVMVNEKIWEGMEQWLARIGSDLAVVSSDLDLPKAIDAGPIEDAEIAPEEADEVAEAPAELVAAEDHGQQAGGQEDTDLRHENAQETEVQEADPEVIFAGWLKACDYQDLVALTKEQLADMTPEQRKKVSSRKSYLKSK